MKRPHLFHVEGEPEAFSALIEAASVAGYKVGWLVFEAEIALPEPLAAAIDSGAVRAVAVTPTGAISGKRRGGPWVLDDLLREHFLGFRALLIRTSTRPPQLERSLALIGLNSWRIEGPEGALEVGADGFVAELRKPVK